MHIKLFRLTYVQSSLRHFVIQSTYSHILRDGGRQELFITKTKYDVA